MAASSNQPLPSSSLAQQASSTLYTLSNRPGVEAALILSRRDGSIIKATGSLEETPPPRSRLATTPPPVTAIKAPRLSDTGRPSTSTSTSTQTAPPAYGAALTNEDPTIDGAEPPNSPPPPKLTRTQLLAAEIFRFVAAASSLNTVLESPLPDQIPNPASSSSPTQSPAKSSGTPTRRRSATLLGGYDDEGNSNGAGGEGGRQGDADDGIKLLRMRSRRYEIIVYPDKRFLACVVQNLREREGR